MALNLLRNSRVFVTINLDSNGDVATSGHTPATTREIQVLDGFSFSQNTGQETVTTNEAGIAPIRGQRSFNTSLEPVDWSFSTYIRPKFIEGTTVVNTSGFDADDEIIAEESVLWAAMSSVSGNGWTPTYGVAAATSPSVVAAAAPYSTVAFGNSNAHQLQAFGLIIQFEAVTYVINNCAVDSATIDFGLDAIAMIAWAGKGTTMKQLPSTLNIPTGGVNVTGGGFTTTVAVPSNDFKIKDTTARFIPNKLSTMTLASLAHGGISTPTNYTIALTGGNITISNNLTYLTPANLGVVNTPITYFTGTRSVTATVTAYLKTGTDPITTYKQGAGLLNDLIAASTSTENKFNTTISIGGATNGTRVDLTMPTVQLTIPTVTSEQIISTSIGLTAQGAASGGAYDLEATNELAIKYYAVQ